MSSFERLAVGLVLGMAFYTCGQADAADTAHQALVNGDFSTAGSGDGAAGWTRGDSALVSFPVEQGNRFCRMTLAEKKAAIINQSVKLDPAWKTLDVAVRVRAKDVQAGEKDWMTGQLQFVFKNKDGAKVGGWNRLMVSGDTTAWKLLERKAVPVPQGAVEMAVSVGVWGASGTFDFDDVQVNAPTPGRAASAPADETLTPIVLPAMKEPTGPIERQDYYVAPDGSDDHDGKSVDKPFRTIGKAAAVMKAGGVCHIRAGVYRETVRPAASGQKDAPITFKPYRGERVVISGADVVAGWQPHAGAIYKAPMAGDFFASPINQADQIFVDGQMMNLARWPDSGLDVSSPAKSSFTQAVSKTRDDKAKLTTGVFVDENLPDQPGDFFKGAEIYIQPNYEAWSWTFTGVVAASTGKQITFQSPNNSGKDGKQDTYPERSRYYLFNSLALLDAGGEWYHDKSAGLLYLRTVQGDDPAKHTVEARRRDFAFVLDDRSYITIQGVELFACAITTDSMSGGDGKGYNADNSPRYPWRGKGFLANSRGVVVEGVTARYLSHFTDVSGHFYLQWGQNTGIVLSGRDHVIRDCDLRYSAGNGVTLLGINCKALNNLIRDVNYASVDCSGVCTGGVAVSLDHEIGHNTIANCGRSGMTPRGLANSDPAQLRARIHHNDISQCMLQDWDGGGIYMAYHDARLLRIDHNRIHDMAGYTVAGIYPDFNRNLIIDHNLVWNVEWAVLLQGDFKDATNAVVYNNTLLVNHTSKWDFGPFGVGGQKGNKKGTLIANNIIGLMPGVTAKGYRPYHGNVAKAAEIASNLAQENSQAGFAPGLANASGGDFQLAKDSPAVGAGKPVPDLTRDGVKVPAFNEPVDGRIDLGALPHGVEPFRAGCTLEPK